MQDQVSIRHLNILALQKYYNDVYSALIVKVSEFNTENIKNLIVSKVKKYGKVYLEPEANPNFTNIIQGPPKYNSFIAQKFFQYVELCPNLTVEDSISIFGPLRLRKSEAEQQLMRTSCKIAASSMIEAMR